MDDRLHLEQRPSPPSAARLREAMKRRAVSQKQLARAVGCSKEAIHKMVWGRTQQSRYLPEIAAILGVPLNWLLNGYGYAGKDGGGMFGTAGEALGGGLATTLSGSGAVFNARLHVSLNRLRAAMKARGLNQSDLANAVGCSVAAISKIIGGQTRRSRYLPSIARCLKVNFEAARRRHRGAFHLLQTDHVSERRANPV
ncbi:Pyocin repressor protein [Sphingomonas paucimobilis]|nr:Pyocin repressor protein [Sphingomonas paucimobilis]